MILHASGRFAALAAGLLAAAALPLAAGAQQAASSSALYTAEQAEAGKKVFESICAKCHKADLTGKDDAPPLSGKYFANSWGGHRVAEIVEFVTQNMPMDAPGTLDEPTYLRAIAYVLSRNGVPAGATPLTKDASGVIPRD